MAEKASRKRVQPKSERLGTAAEHTSTAVREAASVLEGELASGLAGVRKIERRFTKERRIDRTEFDDVLERFRTDIHELIDVGSARIADLRSPDVQDLSRRLTTDAHDLSDTIINMLEMTPEIVERLAGPADSPAPTPAAAKKRSAQAARPRRRSPAGPSK